MRGSAGIIVVVATVASGCSAVWIEHVPKPPPRDEHVRCTQSRSAPIFDSVLTAAASAGLIGSSVSLRKGCGEYQDCLAPWLLAFGGIVTSAVLTVAFGASAAYGYVHTARCRALGKRGELRWASAPPRAWLPPPPPAVERP